MQKWSPALCILSSFPIEEPPLPFPSTLLYAREKQYLRVASFLSPHLIADVMSPGTVGLVIPTSSNKELWSISMANMWLWTWRENANFSFFLFSSFPYLYSSLFVLPAFLPSSLIDSFYWDMVLILLPRLGWNSFVIQAGLILTAILLPQPLKSFAYRHGPPWLDLISTVQKNNKSHCLLVLYHSVSCLEFLLHSHPHFIIEESESQ